MSIFNTSPTQGLKVREIYEIDAKESRALVSQTTTSVLYNYFEPTYERAFNLCWVTNAGYHFWGEYKNQHWEGLGYNEFLSKALRAFGECEIGGLSNLNSQLESLCDEPVFRVDIIHDFMKSTSSGQIINYPMKGSKKHPIILTFPWIDSNLVERHPWAILYVYNNQKETIHVAAVPLIPKKGMEDVFNAL
jgi:hypothetical protein